MTCAGITLRDIPSVMDWWEVKSFLKFLPTSSALGIELYPANKWSQEAYFLADLIDSMQGLLWSLGGGKGAKPKPVKRPTDKETKVLDMTPDEFKEKWNSVHWEEEKE